MFVWDHLPFHQYHAAMPMWTEYSDVSRESSQQVAFGLNVIIMSCVVPYTRTLLHDMFENLSESPHTFCSLATCVQQGWAGVSLVLCIVSWCLAGGGESDTLPALVLETGCWCWCWCWRWCRCESLPGSSSHMGRGSAGLFWAPAAFHL